MNEDVVGTYQLIYFYLRRFEQQLISVDEKLKQLLEWLCPVDIEKHHTNTSIIQQPQTTTWFTDGEELQKLVDGHYKVLWVHGKRMYSLHTHKRPLANVDGDLAGSGKTVLLLVERLLVKECKGVSNRI